MFNRKLSSLQTRLAKLKFAGMSESAQVILDTLGGEASILAATGMSILPTQNGKGVMIQTPLIFGKGVDNVRIELNDDGLFDLKFYNPLKGTTPKIKKMYLGVDGQEMAKIFEKQTGTKLL
jgi:hypothetical protein